MFFLYPVDPESRRRGERETFCKQCEAGNWRSVPSLAPAHVTVCSLLTTFGHFNL